MWTYEWVHLRSVSWYREKLLVKWREKYKTNPTNQLLSDICLYVRVWVWWDWFLYPGPGLAVLLPWGQIRIRRLYCLCQESALPASLSRFHLLCLCRCVTAVANRSVTVMGSKVRRCVPFFVVLKFKSWLCPFSVSCVHENVFLETTTILTPQVTEYVAEAQGVPVSPGWCLLGIMGVIKVGETAEQTFSTVYGKGPTDLITTLTYKHPHTIQPTSPIFMDKDTHKPIHLD